MVRALPLMIRLFGHFRKNPGAPPIETLKKAIKQEQLTKSFEFQEKSVELILFFLWLARFNRFAKRLTHIYLAMCKRLRFLYIPKYNPTAVWLFILTGYVGLGHKEAVSRMVDTCCCTRVLATLVYAIERLGNLANNHFYHHYFYRGVTDMNLYHKVAKSYKQNLTASMRLYNRIKERYLNTNPIVLRGELSLEKQFQTLPSMSASNCTKYLSMLKSRPKKIKRQRTSTFNSSSTLKKTFVLPPRIHVARRNTKPFIGYEPKAPIVVPDFRDNWSNYKKYDIIVNIEKIEKREKNIKWDDAPVRTVRYWLRKRRAALRKYSRRTVIRRKRRQIVKPERILKSYCVLRRKRRKRFRFHHSRLITKHFKRKRELEKAPKNKSMKKEALKKKGKKRNSIRKKSLRKQLLEAQPIWIKSQSCESFKKQFLKKKGLKKNKLRARRHKSAKRIEKLIIRRIYLRCPREIGLRHGCSKPKRKDIAVRKLSIKKNRATFLREVAWTSKEEKKQQEKLKQLMEGAPNYHEYEKLSKLKKEKREKERKKKLAQARLRAKLAYQAAILQKHRMLHHNKMMRKEFDKERLEHRRNFNKNCLKDLRRKRLLRKKVINVRKRALRRKVEYFHKKNLDATTVSLECCKRKSLINKLCTERLKQKRKVLERKKALKKIADIQKMIRHTKPLRKKDIEWEERIELQKKHKLAEERLKKDKVTEIRTFNHLVTELAFRCILSARRNRLLRQSGTKLPILSETRLNNPTKTIIKYGQSILDSFQNHIKNFMEIKTAMIYKMKVGEFKIFSRQLRDILTKEIGINFQKNITAPERACVGVKFIDKLKKVQKTVKWYQVFKKASLLRSKICNMVNFVELCRDGSMKKTNRELREMMMLRKFNQKQRFMMEQVNYIDDVIGAIKLYVMGFHTVPLKEPPPPRDDDFNIRKLQYKLNRMKWEISEIRLFLEEQKTCSTCSEIASTTRCTLSTSKFNFNVRQKGFHETPVLEDAYKQIKIIKLGEKRKCETKVSDKFYERSVAYSSEEESEITLQSFELEVIRKFNYTPKRKQINLKKRVKTPDSKEPDLTPEEAAFMKTQPPGYMLFRNQWGNVVYELKLKNEYKFLWEWAPIAIPKPREKPKHLPRPFIPDVERQLTPDPTDPAILLSTKKHNAKFTPLDKFDEDDRPFIRNMRKRKPKKTCFPQLKEEVRQRYLERVRQHIWDYYKNHPQGGRPKNSLVHIPLSELDEDNLGEKTKTSDRLKVKLRGIAEKLGIFTKKNVKRKSVQQGRKKKSRQTSIKKKFFK